MCTFVVDVRALINNLLWFYLIYIMNYLSNTDLMIDTKLHLLVRPCIIVYMLIISMLTQVSVLCFYELCWKSGRRRRQRGSAIVVVFRTSFCSDAHGDLICWTLTLMRTLMHLCVVVMDYDSTNCYISYLSMFEFLLMYI